MEQLLEFHGIIDGLAFDQIDHNRQTRLRDGTAMTVPHQPFDGMRLAIGDLDMNGRLVTARGIELV